MTETVYAIIEDQSKRSEHDWKIVFSEEGNWGYTTSDKYVVGGPVRFEKRNEEFKFYCVKGSWKA